MKKSKEKRIRESAQEWVREFNHIEYALIEESMGNNIDNWVELTNSIIIKGDWVWSNDFQGEYEVIEVNKNIVILDVDGEKEEVEKNEVYDEKESLLPMWETLWTFGEKIDENWCRNNLDIMKKCGFRVYEYQLTGTLYFGIDGAGYDFYEAHWIPLYKARGLQWHKIDK